MGSINFRYNGGNPFRKIWVGSEQVNGIRCVHGPH